MHVRARTPVERLVARLHLFQLTTRQTAVTTDSARCLPLLSSLVAEKHAHVRLRPSLCFSVCMFYVGDGQPCLDDAFTGNRRSRPKLCRRASDIALGANLEPGKLWWQEGGRK